MKVTFPDGQSSSDEEWRDDESSSDEDWTDDQSYSDSQDSTESGPTSQMSTKTLRNQVPDEEWGPSRLGLDQDAQSVIKGRYT